DLHVLGDHLDQVDLEVFENVRRKAGAVVDEDQLEPFFGSLLAPLFPAAEDPSEQAHLLRSPLSPPIPARYSAVLRFTSLLKKRFKRSISPSCSSCIKGTSSPSMRRTMLW